MQMFTADPRDGTSLGGACNTCCCVQVSVKPGETNKWLIDYAPWTVPMGGRGLSDQTLIDVEKVSSSAPSTPNGNAQVTVGFFGAVTPYNTNLTGDLKTVATDPESNTLTYTLLRLYGPNNGTVALAADGTFTYRPAPGWTGYDRFFYSVTDSKTGHVPVIQEAVIGTSPATGGPIPTPTQAANGTPPLAISVAGMKVNPRLQHLTFGVAGSPALVPGDKYKITVRQQAWDCDNCFWHVMCFDAYVVKC